MSHHRAPPTPRTARSATRSTVLNKSTATAEADPNTASADRFLTMLVTQLKNQDPLNPMDNAQITSQMAQINTVTGLEKVNESIQEPGQPDAAVAGAAGRCGGGARRVLRGRPRHRA